MPSIPTKVAFVALAVAATGLVGCQSDGADSPQPAATTAATTAASSAPAGNGVAALSADEILKRSKAALTQAKSWSAKGVFTQDDTPTTIDLEVDGAQFAGTMSFEKAKVDLLAVGGEKYFRANEQFLAVSTDAKRAKALAKAVDGRWITGADQSLDELFTIGTVDGLLRPTGALSKGEEKQIGGVPAIGLKDAGDPDSVLYVATTGEPYPVQLVGKAGAAVVFGDFGATFTDITKPAGNQIFNLGKAADN